MAGYFLILISLLCCAFCATFAEDSFCTRNPSELKCVLKRHSVSLQDAVNNTFGNFGLISEEEILQILVDNKWTISGVGVPLAFFVLCVASYAYMTITPTARHLNTFPCVRKFPLFGSILEIIGTPQSIRHTIRNNVKLHGSRFVFWMTMKPYLILADAEAAQKVLGSSKHIEKGSDYVKFHWIMGNGLITSNGKIWREDRKLLSPSFKYQRFDGFLNIFNKHSRTLVSILEHVYENDNNGTKASINLHPILCRATMDYITESALGKPSTFQYDTKGSEFLEAVQICLKSFRMRLLKPWLQLPIIWDIFGVGREEPRVKQIISENITDVVKSRKLRKTIKNPTDKSEDDETSPFVDALLDSHSNEDIFAHIVTIFGAGFETTASGMNYTLFLLALNSSCQTKVHEELDRVFPSQSDRSRDVTFADLSELKYLEMCIKESLRLFPPAPVFIRKPDEDISLDNGQIIPRGAEVTFLLYELHRDPKVFPDPETFDPTRFLPEACANRNPYSYMPFSIGPRNCLGQRYAMIQMKAALVHILRNFTVETDQTVENLGLIYGMVLEPFPSIKLTLSKRTQQPEKL